MSKKAVGILQTRKEVLEDDESRLSLEIAQIQEKQQALQNLGNRKLTELFSIRERIKEIVELLKLHGHDDDIDDLGEPK